MDMFLQYQVLQQQDLLGLRHHLDYLPKQETQENILLRTEQPLRGQ
jgi:hypothetical protein